MAISLGCSRSGWVSLVWLVGYVFRLWVARYSSSYVLIGCLGSWCRSGACCAWLVGV